VVFELNPTFFDFIDDFLHYVTHLSKRFLREVDELEGWL
jgi:hypothetical protein